MTPRLESIVLFRKFEDSPSGMTLMNIWHGMVFPSLPETAKLFCAYVAIWGPEDAQLAIQGELHRLGADGSPVEKIADAGIRWTKGYGPVAPMEKILEFSNIRFERPSRYRVSVLYNAMPFGHKDFSVQPHGARI